MDSAAGVPDMLEYRPSGLDGPDNAGRQFEHRV